MKLDSDRYTYIGCIPVSACPDHPEDQTNCIKRLCKLCHQPMWVSEKKRALKKADPSKYKIYCLLCIFKTALSQGYDSTNLEVIDIGKLEEYVRNI